MSASVLTEAEAAAEKLTREEKIARRIDSRAKDFIGSFTFNGGPAKPLLDREDVDTLLHTNGMSKVQESRGIWFHKSKMAATAEVTATSLMQKAALLGAASESGELSKEQLAMLMKEAGNDMKLTTGARNVRNAALLGVAGLMTGFFSGLKRDNKEKDAIHNSAERATGALSMAGICGMAAIATIAIVGTGGLALPLVAGGVASLGALP